MDKELYIRACEKLRRLDEEHIELTRDDRRLHLDVRAMYRQATLTAIFREKIAPLVHEHDTGVRMGLSETRLNELIYSYFYDVDRAKLFHGMWLINEPKKAAYLVKWILKHKPIWYDDDSVTDPSMRGFLHLINEYYALRAALAYTSIRLQDVPAHLMERLLYDFFFRYIDENSMTLWFETFYHFTGRPLDSSN